MVGVTGDVAVGVGAGAVVAGAPVVALEVEYWPVVKALSTYLAVGAGAGVGVSSAGAGHGGSELV